MTSEPAVDGVLLAGEPLSRRAAQRAEGGDLQGALACLQELQARLPSATWVREIEALQARMAAPQPTPLALHDVLRDRLGIDGVYVVNLDRRPDRMARAWRELTAQGLRAVRIPAVDGSSSAKARRLWTRFRRRAPSDRQPSSVHIGAARMARYQKTLGPQVFAYLLSQRRVIETARRNGHRRILVLDDDVFFTRDAATRLAAFAEGLADDWLILQLGTSEYAPRDSTEFLRAQSAAWPGAYGLIGGLSCGSFAAAYDSQVFDDLLRVIDEADGAFDSMALGSLYIAHPGRCFAVDPAACVPDVADSDIRALERTQAEQCARMRWPGERYRDYVCGFDVTVLIDDFDALRHLRTVPSRLRGGQHLAIFYASVDGLRTVVPGRVFDPVDASAQPLPIFAAGDLQRYVDESGMPRSSIVLRWPGATAVDAGRVQTAVATALARRNATGATAGEFDGIVFGLNLGRLPTPGLHSVVIPCFRGLDQAWPSIRSALRQDVARHEVIVVNDRPEDTGFASEIADRLAQLTLDAAVEGWTPAPMHVVQHRRNRGASGARNTGALRACGDMISFLDDDDQFGADRLSAVEYRLATAPDSVGACYCGYDGRWNGERDVSRFRDGNLGDLVLSLQYRRHYLHTDTVTYRRAAFLRLGGFNESYRRHQDLEMLARYFAQYDIVSVQVHAARHRPHPVEETYRADLASLCRLKHRFLSDFRTDIVSRGGTFASQVVDAHLADVLKRMPEAAPEVTVAVRAFLQAALGLAGEAAPLHEDPHPGRHPAPIGDNQPHTPTP
jgi:hypothetical protein